MTQFIKKLLIKIAILVILFTAVTTFIDAGSAIINNYIALGQLENSDGMFILMEMYNNFIKPTLLVVTYSIAVVILVNIAIDIYKFIRTNRKKETKNEDQEHD